MTRPYLFVSAENLSSFQHADLHPVFQPNVLEQKGSFPATSASASFFQSKCLENHHFAFTQILTLANSLIAIMSGQGWVMEPELIGRGDCLHQGGHVTPGVFCVCLSVCLLAK